MKLKPLNIFKPGKHLPMGWDEPLEITQADLEASAAAYDPALYRTPICIGHPKLPDPAFGWLDSLFISADGLEANPVDVEPAFADLVNKDAYPAVSVGWFPPNHKRNPVPGVWYPRELSYLGAVPAAVRGLRKPVLEPAFSEGDDDDDGIVRFGSYEDAVLVRILRSLKNHLIEKDGKEVADKIIDEYDLEYLAREVAREAAREETQLQNPAFAAPPTETSMTPEEIAALKAKADRADQLERDLAAERAKDKARQEKAIKDEAVQFADGLINDPEGCRLAPADKAMVVDLLVRVSTLDEAGGLVQFAGDDGKPRPLADDLKAFLKARPVIVEFAEFAGHDKADPNIGKKKSPLVADAEARAEAARK